MSRFLFKSDQDGDIALTYETNAVTLDEVIDDFAMFLRGCGYQLDGLEQTRDEDSHPNKN